MFFDDEFKPANYIDALFKDYDYSKTSMAKLTMISNNLTIHLNFLMEQLNREINEKLLALNNIAHEETLNNSTRLNYYIKLLQNSIISLNNELQVPEFNQLVIINKLIDFKVVKQNMLDTLKILNYIKKNFGDLTLRYFETDLLKLFSSILKLQDADDKQANLKTLVDCADVFKNMNHFNSIYKRNMSKFTSEIDS
ncbi:hypothetical protein CANTEDRAFT_93545 [Yamadazyma tenuis ATCC 10573]|uniref:Uncharacterized protein n=2 Tax=Candida tenuis TaxID=2315449 RepID=G3B2Y8_CANTC|nr:uncharacterized protein CANTEDRAFT_93545 [Yamadazyma tenuis ATCC 10573]EGV64036.1 hypothetical protein CANTEDRAFT_93545 [Yamadazyma tenuis ATCC 10573]